MTFIRSAICLALLAWGLVQEVNSQITPNVFTRVLMIRAGSTAGTSFSIDCRWAAVSHYGEARCREAQG